MALKHRSRFWIVTTHVLTAGLAMPVLAGLVAFFTVPLFANSGIPLTELYLVIIALGYLAGTYYSLSYLKKNAIYHDWTSCVIPSIVTFSILRLISFTLDFRQLSTKPALLIELLLYYVVIVVFFSVVTRRAFIKLDEE